MKLIEILPNKKEKYYSLAISVLKFEKFSFLQTWADYTKDDQSSPYFQFSMGYGRLVSVLIALGRASFSFDLFGRNWSRVTIEE